MKITIGFNEFNNSPITLGEAFIKAGFSFTQNNEHEYFEVILNDKKDLLKFYKIIVNN